MSGAKQQVGGGRLEGGRSVGSTENGKRGCQGCSIELVFEVGDQRGKRGSAGSLPALLWVSRKSLFGV